MAAIESAGKVKRLVFAWVLLIGILGGCASVTSREIAPVGRIPGTESDCYAVRDHDWTASATMLVCTEEGKIKAAAGGVAPGPASGVMGGVAGGVGSVLQGVLGVPAVGGK